MHLPIAVGEGEGVGERGRVREGSEESSGSEGGEEEIVDVCHSVREWGEEGRFEQGQLEEGRLEGKTDGNIGGKGKEVGGREREQGGESHFEATVAGKGAMIRVQRGLASHNFDAAFFPSLLIVSAIASTLLAVAFAVAPLFEFTDFSTPVVLGVVTAIHLDFALLLLTIVLLSVSVQTPSPLLASLSMTLRLLRRYSHAYLALNFGLLGVLSSLAAACFLLTGIIQNVMLHNLLHAALILACLFSAVVLHAVASTLFVSLALHQMGSIRLPRAF
ncbi:unnamed protein product [Closterium sp. NIES-65]|nr:unnamed protein product [Closterium sp. NIES-65]